VELIAASAEPCTDLYVASQTTTDMPVDRLRCGEPTRSRGIDDALVTCLSESTEPFAPLVVTVDGLVIDGQHRLLAAQRRGDIAVAVVVVEVSEEEANIEAYRRNGRHGIPLTRPDRRRWVGLELALTPEASNGVIAERCGVSRDVVARVRRASACSGGATSEVNTTRIGMDGKKYTVGDDSRQAEAAAIFDADPDVGVRGLQRRTGLSLGAVSNFKKKHAKVHAAKSSAGPRTTASSTTWRLLRPVVRAFRQLHRRLMAKVSRSRPVRCGCTRRRLGRRGVVTRRADAPSSGSRS
jgi:hypothetical protein